MESDLISRSATIEWLERYLDPWADRYECCYEIEHEIPAVDAVPVVHGEFDRQSEEVIPNLRATPLLCKTCKTTFITLNKEGKRCMCCPYCGARMDGEIDA